MASPLPTIRKIAFFALSSRPGEEDIVLGMRALRRIFPQAECLPPPPWSQWTCCRRLAGTDEERSRAFNEAVALPDVELLLAARGGYGVTRVLEAIDFSALRESGKFVVGYSDVTALLLAAYHCGCRRLIHGPMLCSSLADAECHPDHFALCAKSFWEALESLSEDGEETPWPFPAAEASGAVFLQGGTATGPLIPCNLTMLESLIGTPYFAPKDLRGAILVLEDIAVPAHSIDRSLRHLLQCGILPQLAGLAFGAFEQCANQEELPDILREYAARVPGPVLARLPFGHCLPSLSLPFGRQCRLQSPPVGGERLRPGHGGSSDRPRP